MYIAGDKDIVGTRYQLLSYIVVVFIYVGIGLIMRFLCPDNFPLALVYLFVFVLLFFVCLFCVEWSVSDHNANPDCSSA